MSPYLTTYAQFCAAALQGNNSAADGTILPNLALQIDGIVLLSILIILLISIGISLGILG